jgi:hypothetical protein
VCREVFSLNQLKSGDFIFKARGIHANRREVHAANLITACRAEASSEGGMKHRIVKAGANG